MTPIESHPAEGHGGGVVDLKTRFPGVYPTVESPVTHLHSGEEAWVTEKSGVFECVVRVHLKKGLPSPTKVSHRCLGSRA